MCGPVGELELSNGLILDQVLLTYWGGENDLYAPSYGVSLCEMKFHEASSSRSFDP